MPFVTAAACAPPGSTSLVLAASSLTDVAPAIAEAAGIADRVEFSFAGSSSLVAQLGDGAPAEVLVTADAATMDRAVAAGLVSGEVHTLATNHLVLVTPPDDPGGVSSVTDLADPSLLVGLCAPEVPCGALARRLLDRAGLEVRPDTLESHVRALTTKVALGELDAALVYATEVGDDVRLVPGAVPVDEAPLNEYRIATIDAEPSAVARTFVETALSPVGRRLLGDAGFGLPPESGS